MHTFKVKTPTTSKQRKSRKEEQKESFFAEIDSGMYWTYIEEEGFQDYIDSIKSKKNYIRNQLNVTGNDEVRFQVYLPMKYCCALLSQFTFDRESDVSFRSYVDHYVVEIKLARRKDVELLLGTEALATRHEENGHSFTEILCTEVYPITLRSNSKTEFLTVTMDCRTMVMDKKGNFKYSKPSKEIALRKKRTKELEWRNEKKNQSEFDNANIPKKIEGQNEEPMAIETSSKRKRTQKVHYDEKEYRVTKILRSEICFKEKIIKYETLWNNKEITWEPRESFIDEGNFEDGETIQMCEALIEYETRQKKGSQYD